MDLDAKLTSVKGVGPRTAEKLAAAGFGTVGDLINFLPRTYEDFSQVVAIANLTPGKVTVRARVEKVATRRPRWRMAITEATLRDESGAVRAVWFNQHYRQAQLENDEEFYVSGVFEFARGRYQLTNPSVELVKDLPVQTGRVLPIYPAVKGLKPSLTRSVLDKLRPVITMLAETLPAEVVAGQKLLSRADAMLGLHFPASAAQADAARQRLAFEELFELLLASRLNKLENSKLRGYEIRFDQAKIKEFVAALPFALTGAQRRALWDILQDFDKPIEKTILKSRVPLKLSKSNYKFARQIFSETEKKLRKILGAKIKIEHVGSTSVEDLDGKGVVDIAVAFSSIEKMKIAAKRLLSNNFSMSKTPTPEDRIMMRTAGDEPTKSGDAHLHLVIENGEGWNALIGFRNWLREKPENMQAYLAAKRQALARADGDRKLYGQIKREFIEMVSLKNTTQISQEVVPMNRMLQGDVGSGKTVVAGAAAYQAALAGFQTAIMAPTEILATQHAATLDKLLSPFGVSVVLLTGSVKGKAREELYGAIASGAAAVVVGTHALFQKDVEFQRLGFVVIDEQHRFGVKQRQALLAKSGAMPHLLSMTATPIPRSLQLTVFGDLDISILNELPAGRQPIETKIYKPNEREKVYKLIGEQLAQGRQAYVVTPLIEESTVSTAGFKPAEKSDVAGLKPAANSEKKAAEVEFEKFKKVYKLYKVGLLHGKMKADEKEQVMGDFAAGKIQILVATTVIEVGVDVPNATVMLIENGDRFGLSQLHQLRGRVGRGKHQSYCYLMLSDNKPPTRRLREIEKSNDGFYLSEIDLQLRGPGEIYGTIQHGDLNLQIANLADTKLISRAARAADEFIKSGAKLEKYPELHYNVSKYQRLTTLN